MGNNWEFVAACAGSALLTMGLIAIGALALL